MVAWEPLRAGCPEMPALSGGLSQPWCESHYSSSPLPGAEVWALIAPCEGAEKEGRERQEESPGTALPSPSPSQTARALPPTCASFITATNAIGELRFLPAGPPSLAGARAPWSVPAGGAARLAASRDALSITQARGWRSTRLRLRALQAAGSGRARVQPSRPCWQPGRRLPSLARGVPGRAPARALPRCQSPGAREPRGGCEQACFWAGLPPSRASTGPAWPRSPLGAEGAMGRQRFNEGLFGSL